MNNALRDQLLKAGLITEDQVKAANDKPRHAPVTGKPIRQESKNKRIHSKQRLEGEIQTKRRKQTVTDAGATRVRSAHVPTAGIKVKKTSNPAQTPSPYAHLDKAQREAVRRFLREHRVNSGEGEIPYHFQEGTSVRKIWVTPQQREALMLGHLVIVPRNERYYVIDAAQAESLRSLDPLAEVILAEASSERIDDDPAYKDFPIPDDLVW